MAKRSVTSTRDVGLILREASVAPSTLDAEKRTVQITWTTGARVLRTPWFDEPFFEELSLDPKHVRMERLNGGAPLLNSHRSYDLSDVIGVVESARIDGKRGEATVRFDTGQTGDDVFRKVRDGIVRNVSVGYRIHKLTKVESGEGKTPVYRATDWEPYELSMVPIGADAGAVTRSAGTTTRCEFVEERAMPDPVPTTVTPPAQPVAAAAPAVLPVAAPSADHVLSLIHI